MMTISNVVDGGGSSIPPAVDVSGDDDVVPIYLRLIGENEGDGFYWWVIKIQTAHRGRCSYQEVSSPRLLTEKEPWLYSGFVSVGSTLYALGGRGTLTESKPIPSWKWTRTLTPPLRDVFYINTLCPESGWKKLEHPMNLARAYPDAFTVNGKIYVVGGVDDYSGKPSPYPEVLDTHRIEEGWRPLRGSNDVPHMIDGYAVLDGGKRVLMLSRADDCRLHCYDVEADSWQVYNKNVSVGEADSYQSAYLDGIIYYLDYERPGIMFGVDVSGSRHEKRVRLPLDRSKCGDWDWQWIPQPILGYLPRIFLVSLGSGKLAALWTGCIPPHRKGEQHVFISTIQMSREEQEGGADFDLVALPLSLSDVFVPGSVVNDCLTIFPSQTRGPQEDVSKDDNTISTQEENKIKENKKKGKNEAD